LERREIRGEGATRGKKRISNDAGVGIADHSATRYGGENFEERE